MEVIIEQNSIIRRSAIIGIYKKGFAAVWIRPSLNLCALHWTIGPVHVLRIHLSHNRDFAEGYLRDYFSLQVYLPSMCII